MNKFRGANFEVKGAKYTQASQTAPMIKIII